MKKETKIILLSVVLSMGVVFVVGVLVLIYIIYLMASAWGGLLSH